MPLTSGARLGPYEIVSALGAGGMGEVYRARDTRLERTVAVKVLPSHLSSSAESRQRFEREAKTISQLSHPHICALYDVGREGETEYLVMEYLEGETLSERLAKGPLPLEQTLRYGVEIADALDKAHRQGIVHRDLKPGNVMLTKSGVKLLDFGLAKALPSPTGRGVGGEGQTSLPTQANFTQEGTILGTFQYMAPEQLEGKEADSRTDIFAFGAVLYEMATGRKAFSGTSQASLISAIMKEDPAPVSQIQPMTPPALDRVVKTCLAKDPEDRWQSAADIKRELRWIAEGSAAGLAVPGAVSPGRRNRERLAWGIATLAGLLAAGALLLSRRPAPAPAPRTLLSILPPQGTVWTDWFALSPDGRKLAFVGASEGRSQIWVRDLGEKEARPLSGTDTADDVFWSPDGRSLGFFAQSKLKKIELESGAIEALCDAELGRGGAWSREGVILFYNAVLANLSRVSARGGAAVPATRLDASRGDTLHRWPQFLPDGKRFIAFVRAATPETTGIYLGTLDSPTLTLLQASKDAGLFVPPDRLLYARGDTLVAQRIDVGRARPMGEPETLLRQLDVAETPAYLRLFSASANGVIAFRDVGNQRPLLWFDRRGNVVGRTSAIAAPGLLSLSADEALATYPSGGLSGSDVWILDLKRDVPTKFTFDNTANNPVFSRDGRFVYYRSFGPKRFEIRRKPLQGGGLEETVFEGRSFEAPADETPNGRTLVVTNTRRSLDVWSLPLGGDRKLVPLVTTEFAERSPKLSPDGRWLAYGSDESGRWEVYVRRFPVSEEKWQVSARGGSTPYWRGDGNEIYYVALDGTLTAVPVSAGKMLSVGAPESLFQTRLRNPISQRQFAASSDGERFLLIYPTQDPSASPMQILLNGLKPAAK